MSDSHFVDELPPSGNVMDLLNDEAWLREAVRLEEAAGADIGAGPRDSFGSLRSNCHNLGELLNNPAGYRQFLRVRRLVLRGFKAILAEGNFGAGTEAAWACGKPLVMLRLEEPAIVSQEVLLALLNDSENEAHPMPTATVQSIRAVLREVLRPEDWEAIASTAAQAIHHQTLQGLPRVAPSNPGEANR